MSNSDKHSAYLVDPDDIDLNIEFSGLNEDEVEELKRECVEVRITIWLLWLTNDYQVGNAATQPSKNSTTSSPTSRKKLMRGRLRNSTSFMQRRVKKFDIGVFTY